MKKIAGILILLVTISGQLFAGDYSYVYIEGDKQTPFYVKLEGEMMPRLGKNYCILPDLDAGIIHVQILFQQNAYPEQDFVVRVPESGERGFVLQKVNDRQFALQDLKTKKYLVAGNKDDDAMGDTVNPNTEPDTPVADEAAATANSELIPAFEPKKKNKNKADDIGDDDTRFINNVALNTEKNKEAALPDFTPSENHPVNKVADSRPEKKHKEKPVGRPFKGIVVTDDDAGTDTTVFADAGNDVAGNDIAIPNSDCPEAMSNNNFEDIAIKYLDRQDDDSKLRYMTKTGIKYCYSTEQVRILAKNMDSQSARYELVTALYHRVVDQSNYSKLQDLFNSSYLRGKFMETLSQ